MVGAIKEVILMAGTNPEIDGVEPPLKEYLDSFKIDMDKINKMIADAQEEIKKLQEKIKALIEKYL